LQIDQWLHVEGTRNYGVNNLTNVTNKVSSFVQMIVTIVLKLLFYFFI